MLDLRFRAPQVTGNCIIFLKISTYVYLFQKSTKKWNRHICLASLVFLSFIYATVCGCDLFIFIILHSTRQTFGLFSVWVLRTMLNFLKYVTEFPWIRISGPWSVQSFNFTKQGQMYSTMIESSNEQYIRAPTIIPSLTSRLLPLKHFYPMCNTCIFFPL